MCSQPAISASSFAGSPACSIGDVTLPAPNRHARLRRGFWGRLLARRLPRLDLDGLSAHRLRDLGFSDGRAAAPRDQLRD